VAEKFATLEKQAERREREREAAFQSDLRQRIQSFEQQSRELLQKIADRAERLKVEKEAQKRAGQLKREAQRAATGNRSAKGPVAEVIPPREVRVLRDGAPLSKAPEAGDEIYRTASDREIAVGDKVRLKSFGSVGIVDAIKGDVAEIRVKSLRMREKLEDLELVELTAPPAAKANKFARLSGLSRIESQLKPVPNGRSELNVIGRTQDEAVDEVDKFLDEASMASLSQVRIVHGHGTGALRRAISELLKDHPHVARFNPAPQDQGGSGATLVELKS
jgi:DNA mismatch repair protein MutS2